MCHIVSPDCCLIIVCHLKNSCRFHTTHWTCLCSKVSLYAINDVEINDHAKSPYSAVRPAVLLGGVLQVFIHTTLSADSKRFL